MGRGAITTTAAGPFTPGVRSGTRTIRLNAEERAIQQARAELAASIEQANAYEQAIRQEKRDFRQAGGTVSVADDHYRVWRWHRQTHRETGPSVEEPLRDPLTGKLPRRSNGSYYYTGQGQWHQWGEFHRTGGPAIADYDGRQEWWYQHGQLHRTDGPAVITRQWTAWHQFGMLHREDGPALVTSGKSSEWHLYGQRFADEAEFRSWLDQVPRIADCQDPQAESVRIEQLCTTERWQATNALRAKPDQLQRK